MKTYVVVRTYPETPDVFDLKDTATDEQMPASDEDFTEGETVTEDQIVIRRVKMVNDECAFTADMAFKKE